MLPLDPAITLKECSVSFAVKMRVLYEIKLNVINMNIYWAMGCLSSWFGISKCVYQ